MTKYNWEKIERDFLKSKMTGSAFCEKNNITKASFYANIKSCKTKKIIEKNYKKKFNKKLDKISEKRAETDAELWSKRSLENKEQDFKMLKFQKGLLSIATADLKPTNKKKVDLKELDLAGRIFERLVSIGERLMGVEEDKPDMPTDSYNESTIQVEQELKMDELEEYQKCIEQIEGERKDK